MSQNPLFVQLTLRTRLPGVLPKKALRTIPGVSQVSHKVTNESFYWLDVELEDMQVEGWQERESLRNRLLSALVEAQIPILNYDAAGVSLQDVFLQLTDEEE
jgi:hypothetical protein